MTDYCMFPNICDGHGGSCEICHKQEVGRLSTRLQRAEELLREAKGWCPQGETSGGIGKAPKPANGVRDRIDAFLGERNDL